MGKPMGKQRGLRYTSDVIGIPVVPPGNLTRGVARARAFMLRAHRLTAPPPLRVLESLLGIIDNVVLGLL